MHPRPRPRSLSWRVALGLGVLLFLLYDANGREIPSYDSQPTKLTAVQLALHHTLTLDGVVGRLLALAERPGFAVDRGGHYRSAYPVAPAIIAAGVAGAGYRLGLSLRSPRAQELVSKITASLLTACAVVFAFLAARRRVDTRGALLIAIGLGAGTNFWALTSQTLWQHETAAFGLAGAVACLAVPTEVLTFPRLLGASALLALAGAARPQLAPAVIVIAASIALRRRRSVDVLALVPLAAAAAAAAMLNVQWFGSVLGAMPRLEALHQTVHGAEGSVSATPWIGTFGLLLSPSRGLVVFSPIVLIVAGSVGAVWRDTWRGELRWWALAAAAQFLFYASYGVWWGGHTYGPRYVLDLLPLLVPLAATGLPRALAGRTRQWVAGAALAWSILVSATGAFCYPAEQWNTDPSDVDRDHARLWDWGDSEIVRCWERGLSPRNFRFFKSWLDEGRRF